MAQLEKTEDRDQVNIESRVVSAPKAKQWQDVTEKASWEMDRKPPVLASTPPEKGLKRLVELLVLRLVAL